MKGRITIGIEIADWHDTPRDDGRRQAILAAIADEATFRAGCAAEKADVVVKIDTKFE